MRRIRLAATLGCVAVLSAVAQDPVKVSPEGYKVEAENDQVRIVRMKRGPHNKAPMHEHPPFVVIFLTDVHQRVTDSDGQVRETARKAGEVAFNSLRKHAEENLSDQPMESLLIELKSAATPAGTKLSPLTLDLLKVDPKHAKLGLENDRVRVLRIKRGPHEGTPMHEHPEYVAVFLTDVHQRVIDSEGNAREVTRKRGEFSLNRPTKHEEIGLSDQPLEAVLVELKSGTVPGR